MCDDMSRANPRNFYGVTKAFGESILNYFCHKSGGKIEGVSVRLPAVISYRPRSLPPFRASTAYLSEMISKTLLGESYDIPVCKDTVIPIIGYKDAVDALKFLSSVLDKLPEERVVNIPGLSPSAEQIVNALVKYLNSSIKIRYKQDDITLKVVGTILKYVKGSALEATEYRLKRDLIGIISDVDEQIKTIKDPVSD